VFRRRRTDADQPAAEFPGELAGEDPAGQDEPALAGPWDAGASVPGGERLDFGSLQVPAGEGFEVQVSVVDNQPAWITVLSGESGLQLQAFAAPKTGGLWDEVRAEIAAEVARNGGQSSEDEGPFGIELRARIIPAEPVHSGPGGQLQPVRFLGADGPRWFLRGLITGPAAQREDLAEPLERVFGGVVVVRGDHPVPPRDLLEIRLPDEIMTALAGELAGPEEGGPEQGGWPGNPFERGPEITETR
jgi:hypothetical protein